MGQTHISGLKGYACILGQACASVSRSRLRTLSGGEFGWGGTSVTR